MADEAKAPAAPAVDAKDAKDPKDSKDVKDVKDAKDPKSPKDAKAKPKAAPGKKGGPLFLILGLVGGLVVIVGVSLAIIYMVVLPKAKSAEASAKKKPEKAVEAAMGPMFQLKDMVINSADKDEIHYIKVGMAFEVASAKQVEELGARDAVLRDLMITEFGKCTVAELNTPEGRQRIRDIIKAKMSEKMKEIPVRNLYFTEFVGQ